jgi:uncharacterized membrane protein YbhN (UPF0104 family)
MRSTPPPRRRTVAFLLGLGLLGAAGVVLARHAPSLHAALAALRQPSLGWLLAVPTAVIATVALTAAVQQCLLNRVMPLGRVGFGESAAMTLASALGNLLPMQPGLVGRVAYQHRVFRIPVTTSVLLAVQATLLTLGAAVWIAIACGIVRWTGASWLAVPASVILALPLGLRGHTMPALWIAFALRFIETLLGAVRCSACFELIGQPIDPLAALVLASASSAANCIPMLGNGLGVREWVTGLLAPAVAGMSTPDALAAELLNRLFEIVLVALGGALSMPMLSRRLAESPQPSVPDFGAGFTWPQDSTPAADAQRPAGDSSPPNALPPPSS